MLELLPPGMLLIVGGLLLTVLPGKLRSVVTLLLPVVGLVHLWMVLPLGFTWDVPLFDYTLQIVRVDGLSRIFGTIFHLAAFVSALYAWHVDDRLQQSTSLMYAGAAIGAVFAGDLATLFVYWELTAITSVFLIWASRNERSYRTGLRYLIIQVSSGVLLLAGALAWASQSQGDIAFGHLGIDTVAGQLIFLAFGIKAAFPFLHNWLQEAYPEATVTGTVWLSAFTTKLAIYALARGYAGVEILVPIGAAMTAFPIFFAVLENDLRRVLSYSMNNQLGYMVVGIGIGTELAVNGAAAHAFAHILYKGLLFMSMGAVLQQAGTIKASELGGLWRSMKWTTLFCIIGAAAISAVPLFSGFVTKSMILTAAAEEHYTITFLVLLFASAGVVDHSGIKVPFFAFFAHDSGKRPQEAPWNMLLAMGIVAFLCVAIGVYYQPLYAILPYPTNYVPYDWTHTVTQVQLLAASAAAFVFLQKMGLYPPELRSVVLDADWTYRKVLPAFARMSHRVSAVVYKGFWDQTDQIVRLALSRLRHAYKPPGPMGEPWPTGQTALWAAIVLGATLLLASI